jgi:SulP family sulfate permease
VSAAVALAGLARRLAERGTRLWLTGAGPELGPMILRADAEADFRTAPELDTALASEEETLLAGEAVEEDGAPPSAMAALLERIETAGHGGLFERQEVSAGTVVYRQGAASNCLVLLEAGRMSAWLATPQGGQVRVATILPGAMIGEIGFFGGIDRTATVVADTDCVLRHVHRSALEDLIRRDQGLGRDFLACGAALMAQRLARTNALIRHTHR